MRGRIKAFVFTAAFLMVLSGPATASTVNLSFTNSDVDLGLNSQINLTNQYSAFGISFDHVYRYIDSRDPFSDDYGISNGFQSQNGATAALGRVDFSAVTPYVTFDWWTISSTFNISAYDSLDSLVGTFSGSGNGTQTINGSIKYFTFNDSGGFVQIANLKYDTAAVPEPSTLLLIGFGLAGLAGVRRFRK